LFKSQHIVIVNSSIDNSFDVRYREIVSMLLYMDVHVPFAITAGLRLRGVDVLTAQEDGAAELDDDLLLDRAALSDVLSSLVMSIS
jgi:hypothetical protein